MKYFTVSEFNCTCCNENKMNESTMEKADSSRGYAGIPFNITSGYRCPEHNRDVGGVDNSAHTRGYAFDIHCDTSAERSRIIDGLIKGGFNRIGISANFIHADDDPTKPENVLWLY